MITVPDNTIAVLSYDSSWQNQQYIDAVFEPLKGKNTRDWFVSHAYHCLPIVMGNQYGFVVKSLYDAEIEWNGGNKVEDVIVNILSDQEFYEKNKNLQNISSHFGMGVVTVQNAFTLRTPPGINLMTINPPNSYIDGICHMTGVVEADNLRRDFTYNLRVTRPNHKIKIKVGDYIGCIIPYPRHFIDKYQMIDANSLFTTDEMTEELKCMKDFATERSQYDTKKTHGNGKRYWRGEDVYGNKFSDHQTGLDK